MFGPAHVEQALLKANWTFARTMPHTPHFWTARKDWGDKALFDEVVGSIMECGRPEKFRSYPVRNYLYVFDGLRMWRYWVMSPPGQATIINKCDPSDPKIKPYIKVV